MVNKKLLISFLLILLVAVSAGVVSAADSDDTLVAAADTDDAIAAAAEEDSADALSATIDVDGDTDADIADAIEEAADGDTIDLGKNKVYNFSSSVTIDKNVTITGENVTLQGIGSDMPDGLIEIYEDGAGSTISGLTFNNLDDANKYLYNGNTKIKPVGIAISIAGTEFVTVDNCVFNNWFNSAISLSSANFALIQNSQFYGGTATFINNIPDGPKDRGTYHISAMSSKNTIVYNNSFMGTVCDGVSVAGNSLNSQIIGNYFEDNAFSIYFGGKSTEGTLIESNTFVNCGWFESDVYTTEGVPTGDHVLFTNLPVISVQKSADSFIINDNTFIARNGNILIKALEGSTAHGGASSIGNITITNNIVESISNDIVMSSIDFTYIETYNEIIKPIGEIKVANNVLNGARAVTYWSLAWGDMWGDASIKAADLTTYISAYDLSTNGVSAVLKDAEGNALTGETISYTSALGNGTVETDEYGNILIEKVYGFVDLFFEGNDNYLPCNLTVYVAPTTIDTFLQAADVVVDYASGQKLTATLLDVFGNPVSGLNVKITVGTLAKTLKTNANGQVSLDVSHLDPGNYTAQIKAATSAIYNRAEPITANVYVKPISHLVAESFVTGYNSGDLFVVSLLDEYGNAISGVNVKITVGTIAKTLKTDANGQVALDISGLDIGDYVATIKAATSEAYSRAAQITTDITITKGQSILIADDFTTAHNSGEKFVASLVNGKGEALSGVNVKITVGTIAKTLKTDANGQVALDVSTLEPGSYTAKIISANTDLYNKATPINSNVTITA